MLKRNLLFFLFFSILLFFAGFFFYQKNKINQNPPEEIAEEKVTPSPEAKVTEPPATKEKLTASFQEILTKNCLKISFGKGSYFYGILPANLPISIDPSVKLKYREENTFACAGDPAVPNSQYVLIETVDGISLNLFDANSKEGGHGGYLFLGPLPNLIGEKNGISFSVGLNWPDGGCASPDYLALKLRGQKSLKLSNGEIVFLNSITSAVKEGDPRLTEILSKNTQPCQLDPERKEVVYEGTEEKVKNKFFAGLNNLADNEQQVVEKLTALLNSISPK
ncbi:MAG TPA: hypothetical protein PKI75_02865 [Candidatus Woesebacteria bacterium]|nr:hypothetical protein [Candidatus Woesebacteria bacterium]